MVRAWIYAFMGGWVAMGCASEVAPEELYGRYEGTFEADELRSAVDIEEAGSMLELTFFEMDVDGEPELWADMYLDGMLAIRVLGETHQLFGADTVEDIRVMGSALSCRLQATESTRVGVKGRFSEDQDALHLDVAWLGGIDLLRVPDD